MLDTRFSESDPKETFEAVHSAHRPLARARQLRMTRYRALVCRLSMISRQTVPPFRVMLEAAVQRGCLPSMPRFASCVQNGASRTIFPAALFIVVGMADRSAARIPSRQALLQQAVVPVAQQEVVAAAEAPGAQREVVAAAAAEAPGAQREVVAVAVVPVAQQEVAAVAVVPVAQQEVEVVVVVVVVATVPASQQEVVATEAAAPA